MELNFPTKQSTGIEKLLSHVSRECVDIIKLLLTYDPEERITATQALKHEFFRELYEIDQIKDFHSSLTSIRLSPKKKNAAPTVENQNDKTFISKNDSILDNSQNDSKDKSIYISSTLKKNATIPKKEKKILPHNNNIPSLQMSLKIDNILKMPNQVNDSMGEEETDKVDKSGIHLPPIKNPLFHLETKLNVYGQQTQVFQTKKKDIEARKYFGNLLKPTLSNQYLMKKTKKMNYMYKPKGEFYISGKKGNYN